MKLSNLIGVAFFLLLGIDAQATAIQHFAVSISGVLSTEMEAGNVASIQTSHITNNTILNALIENGNAGGATKASELDIVISNVTGNFYVDVIKKSDHSLVSGLGNNGSNYLQTGFLVKLGKSFATETTIGEGYMIALPNIAQQTVNIDARLLIHLTASGSVLTGLTMSFLGGSGTQGNGATVVQGTMRKARAIYDY